MDDPRGLGPWMWHSPAAHLGGERHLLGQVGRLMGLGVVCLELLWGLWRCSCAFRGHAELPWAWMVRSACFAVLADAG